MSELPLFVYGTLRSDASRSGLLGDRRREPATVRGDLYSLPAGYPAVDPAGEGTVQGELVHDIDAAVLGVVDFYEDTAGGLFRRMQADARVGLLAVGCWIYVMDGPWRRGGRPVRSGRWRAIDR